MVLNVAVIFCKLLNWICSRHMIEAMWFTYYHQLLVGYIRLERFWMGEFQTLKLTRYWRQCSLQNLSVLSCVSLSMIRKTSKAHFDVVGQIPGRSIEIWSRGNWHPDLPQREKSEATDFSIFLFEWLLFCYNFWKRSCSVL
jgi:hypothetical protein